MLWLLFNLVLSLFVLGLIYFAVGAIWEAMRSDRTLEKLDRETRSED